MHTPEEQPWDGGDLQYEVEVENVAAVRTVRLSVAVTFFVCHPDVSEDIPLGTFYYKGPFGQLRQEVAKDVSRVIRDLEAGIPETGCATLSSDSDGSAIHGTAVALEGLVRNSGVGR